jgi:hypothetical protein
MSLPHRNKMSIFYKIKISWCFCSAPLLVHRDSNVLHRPEDTLYLVHAPELINSSSLLPLVFALPGRTLTNHITVFTLSFFRSLQHAASLDGAGGHE